VLALLTKLREEWARAVQPRDAPLERSAGSSEGQLSNSRQKESLGDQANWMACFEFLNKEYAKEKDSPKGTIKLTSVYVFFSFGCLFVLSKLQLTPSSSSHLPCRLYEQRGDYSFYPKRGQ
jgi:hypothetical protein